MSYVVTQLLNAVSYGSLLFTIASGLSLIFGLMKITNMAHVGFFTMGLYFGYTIYNYTGSFILAIIISAILIGGIGLLVFKFLLQRLHKFPLGQILLGLGLLFFIDDALLAVFGAIPQRTPTPPLLEGSIPLFNGSFSKYRLFLIGVGLVMMLALYFTVSRTKVGALVRSGVDDAETTKAMGVNIYLLFTAVYVGGTMLAAVGGVLGGPLLGMEPRMAFTLMPISLAIVILGGMGNLVGTYFASLLIGTIDTFARALFPDFAYFSIFLPMAIICVVRPEGLFSFSPSKALKRKAGRQC